MKAAVVTRFGSPDVLQFRDIPQPVPGPGQILVRVCAIGLNFADIFARFGVYPGTPKPPFVPGLEFAGDVAAIGAGVTLLRTGDRVMGYSRLGSHAEYVVLGEFFAVQIPATLSYVEGASLLITSMTAYHGLVRLANLRKGERVLIHAAAGGVGIASVQLARHIGGEIFATAGTDAKVAFALSQGAHHGINYATGDFCREVLRLTDGHGADVIMDSVGGEVFRKSWKILAPMGRYVLFGISAVVGKGALNYLKAALTFLRMPPIFGQTLLSSNKAIIGFNLGTLQGVDAYFREAAGEVLRLQCAGVFRPVVGKIFPFDEIVDAHRYLQLRRSVGKVVVTLDAEGR